MRQFLVSSFYRFKPKGGSETIWMIKGSLMILFIKGLGSGIQFLQTFFVVRLFGLEYNGVLALFISLINGFGLLSVFGLDNLTMRKVSTLKDMEDFKTEFKQWTIVYALALIFTIVIAVSIFSCAYLALSFNALWWLVCITLLPMTFLKIFSFYSRGILKIARYAFVEFISVNLVFLLLLGLWYLLTNKKFTVNAFMLPKLFALGVFILATLFLVLLFKRDNNLNIRNSIKVLTMHVYQKHLLKKVTYLLGKSYHFLFSNATIVMTSTLISVVISSKLSDRNMGIYDTVLKVSQLAVIPLMGINGVLSPKIAAYYHKGDLEKMRKQVYLFTLISTAVTLVITAFLLLFFNPIISFVDHSLQAYFKLFYLLLGAQVLNVLTGPVGLILQMTREEKVFNKIVILSCAIYLSITYFFIRQIGLDMVGYSYLLFIVFTTLCASYFVYKKFKFIPMMAFIKIYKSDKYINKIDESHK